jgi:hypothetical protein
MALDNIFTRMKEKWKYRGSKGDSRVLRYEIFKSNIRQQLKSKRAQMKMCILKGLDEPVTICLDHWLNMVKHTHDPKKIE